jgi:hypothetical protein
MNMTQPLSFMVQSTKQNIGKTEHKNKKRPLLDFFIKKMFIYFMIYCYFRELFQSCALT